jgi:adhesin transport system membrane fusion protein
MSKQLSYSIRKADIILYTSLLFWVIMFLWSYFATLEEVTRGQGRVIASSKIQVIQNLEGGIVKEILVQTGDEVTQSQLLINSMIRDLKQILPQCNRTEPLWKPTSPH